VGTALASRANRSCHPRRILAAALAAVGVPMLLLAVTCWPAVAMVLAGLAGTGALLVEILTDTCLQRVLDQDVLGRAYGLALPAAIGGAVLGYAIVILSNPGTTQPIATAEAPSR
jgi:hypothetical protein